LINSNKLKLGPGGIEQLRRNKDFMAIIEEEIARKYGFDLKRKKKHNLEGQEDEEGEQESESNEIPIKKRSELYM